MDVRLYVLSCPKPVLGLPFGFGACGGWPGDITLEMPYRPIMPSSGLPLPHTVYQDGKPAMTFTVVEHSSRPAPDAAAKERARQFSRDMKAFYKRHNIPPDWMEDAEDSDKTIDQFCQYVEQMEEEG